MAQSKYGRNRKAVAWMNSELNETKMENQQFPKESFMSLAKDFSGYTSAHGLERVMSAKQWFRKAFWSLLFVAAITVLGFQVHTQYHKFQQRPLVTLFTLQSDTVRKCVSKIESI